VTKKTIEKSGLYVHLASNGRQWYSQVFSHHAETIVHDLRLLCRHECVFKFFYGFTMAF